jgi:hypothetical protein
MRDQSLAVRVGAPVGRLGLKGKKTNRLIYQYSAGSATGAPRLFNEQYIDF